MLTRENIKTELSKLMELYCITPEQLAVKTGMSVSTIFKWASSKYKHKPKKVHIQILNKFFKKKEGKDYEIF